MKRVGYLFDKVVEPDNLRLAFWKAQKGKSGLHNVKMGVDFRAGIWHNLRWMEKLP